MSRPKFGINIRKKVKFIIRRSSYWRMSPTVERLEAPVKSESDKKSYRVVRISNGLTALLVSDPTPFVNEEEEEGDEEDEEEGEEGEEEEESDEESGSFEDKPAACALCVRCGSHDDPMDVQGMAHFVEHMVFMGSAKYPAENDFDAYVRKKGGSSNAQTDCEMTLFHFEIQENHLCDAMDRFAQFFVAPLMKKDAMQREREAIESEFALAVPSDQNRKEQLLCSTLPAGHPTGKFMWGNARSLSPPVGPDDMRLYAATHAFRRAHYGARRMTVAVQARLPLDTLEKYVVDSFGDVPDKSQRPNDFSRYAFSPATVTPEFHSFYYVKPTMQSTNLTLTWCMRSFLADYKTKPHSYVGWVLGHEGTGSLLVYLQRRVWALNIFSGTTDGGVDHTSLMSLFSVSLVLTHEGLKHVDEVIEAVFGYINMMKREGPCERIFKELKDIEEINFRFGEEPQPVDNVEQLAENMQLYPPEHYITGQELYFEYDPDGIDYVVDHLSADTVNVMLQSQDYTEPIRYDSTEEWFGTEYKKTEISRETVERWKRIEPCAEFHLPEPNPFIPDNFDLIPAVDTQIVTKADGDVNVPGGEVKLELVPPRLIKKDELMEVWFKPDYRFGLPHAHIMIYFITPLVTESPRTACLLGLWNTALHQLLNEKLYAADVTGLSRSLFLDEEGLVLKLQGFSQKLPIVIDEITQMLKNYKLGLTEKLFTALKDVQTKGLTNTIMKPNKLGKEIRLSIIINSTWTSLEKLKALNSITYADLLNFGEEFSKKLYVKMLMQGNLLQEDSMNVAGIVTRNLQWSSLENNERPDLSVNTIPLGEKFCKVSSFNAVNENSVITNYYQFGVSDMRSLCIVELVMLMMEEPLFDTLRTKEQLGYDVHNSLRYTRGVLGFLITVNAQISKFSPEHIDSRIENFLEQFLATTKKTSQSSFEQFKTALVKLKNCVDIELKDEVRRNWGEIASSEYQFDKLLKEIECVKSLTLDCVVAWLDDHTKSGNASNFRKISVQVVGHKKNDSSPNKKIKLGVEIKSVLYDCNYSLNYLSGKDNSNEYIEDIDSYRSSLKVYPKNDCGLHFEKKT